MKRYDLNLLAALDALLRARSVSGAAKQLGVGQPAMSAALGRLRALFDDPLLVRGPRGMEPTPRALAVSQPLREALAALDLLVEPEKAFDPATARRTFHVSGGDYVGMVLVPTLIAMLRERAPGVDLRVRFVEKDDVPARLDDGQIDLALLVTGPLPPRFIIEPLFNETFVCAARVDHPAPATDPDLARFVALDHLLITERSDARGRVDDVLETMGLARRVAFTVPSAAMVADVLRATDLVSTIPRRAGARIAADDTIRLFEPPIDAGDWTMSMAWLARNEQEPGASWLRMLVRLAVFSTAPEA